MDDILRWAPLVGQIAPMFAISPTVVLAIIAVETGGTGDPDLVHPKVRATGLMQVVPGEVLKGRPSIAQLKTPALNVAWGCYLLAGYIRRDGSLYEGLYRYSGGSAWESRGEYERRYWVPFMRAKLEISAALAERGDAAMADREFHHSYRRLNGHH